MNTPKICASFVKCIFDFQNLLSGFLAIAAAVITALVIWKSANLPLEKQRKEKLETEKRQRQFISFLLAHEFRLLASRALQAKGTIKVTIAANANVTDQTREKTILSLHPAIQEWEFMSLLPQDLFQEIMVLSRKVEDHNFDMKRAGGSFGDDNFQRIVQQHAQEIHDLAFKLSNKLIGAGR
ncbi:MAG: hypothetical protein V1721_03660 [Pseudomonadota bacterium]